MRKHTLFALLLLSLSAFAARPQTRAVVIDTVCNAPIETMLQVVDKFSYEFQACPDSLFLWAYEGLKEEDLHNKKTAESRDAIQLRYKDRVYDPEHKIGDVAIDVYVLGVRWWKNQHLVTKYMVSHPDTEPYPITAHLTADYSGSVLENGDIYFVMEPISESQTRVHYEFSLTFGRVLAAFISNKTWHNAIEWRFEVILENLVEYAETGTVQHKERGPKK